MRKDFHGFGDRDIAWRHVSERNRHRPDPRFANSPDEVFGEIGLVLVVVLGIVLAINLLLMALNIS